MAFAIYIVLFLGLFIGVLNILPNAAPLSPAFADAFTNLVAFVKSWDFLFAISDLLICFGLFISLEVGIFVWNIFKRVFAVVGSVRGG